MDSIGKYEKPKTPSINWSIW